MNKTVFSTRVEWVVKLINKPTIYDFKNILPIIENYGLQLLSIMISTTDARLFLPPQQMWNQLVL